MYHGKIQQNPLCAASCHQESSHLPPVLAYRYDFRLYAQNPVFEIVHEESVKVYLNIHACVVITQRECSVEPSMRRILCDLRISHPSPVLANDF